MFEVSHIASISIVKKVCYKILYLLSHSATSRCEKSNKTSSVYLVLFCGFQMKSSRRNVNDTKHTSYLYKFYKNHIISNTVQLLSV